MQVFYNDTSFLGLIPLMSYAEALSIRFDWGQLNQPTLYIIAISSLTTYAFIVSFWNRLSRRSESKESAQVNQKQWNARVSDCSAVKNAALCQEQDSSQILDYNATDNAALAQNQELFDVLKSN